MENYKKGEKGLSMQPDFSIIIPVFNAEKTIQKCIKSIQMQTYSSFEAILIDTDSAFLGKTLRESGIRDKYHCLIAGVERGGEALMTPDVNVPFEEGDVVWVVGENEDVYRLIGQNCDRKR